MGQIKTEIRQQIIDALILGHTTAEIATLTGVDDKNVRNYLKRMTEDGTLTRVSRGKYVVSGDTPAPQEPQAPYAPVLLETVIESIRRVVEIPPFLRRRKPSRIIIIHDEEEVTGVLKLEVCVQGLWWQVYFDGDLRMMLGRYRPNWSGTQVTYDGVEAYRITYADGTQCEIGHDATMPFTIDGVRE